MTEVEPTLKLCFNKNQDDGKCPVYVVGSKSFRPDIQKPRQMEMLWGIYSAIYELLVHRCEKCVEMKGDYVEK